MIIISSNNHAMNWYGASVYATVKEALVKFTRHAAMEFAQYGIRVNCIAPGWIDTGEARMGGGQKERSIPAIPMKRWVQPEEIGQWILFLDGPAAASLTGDTIELDGGVRIMTESRQTTGSEKRRYTEKRHWGDLRKSTDSARKNQQDAVLLVLYFGESRPSGLVLRGTASDSLPEGVGKVFDGGKTALLRRIADGQPLREEGTRMLQADLLQIGH